jgi:alpha-ketoglutaric semialdehyde dehydrogenase
MRTKQQAVLVDGEWRAPTAPTGTFHAFDPSRRKRLDDVAYPVSGWDDLEAMLRSGARAARDMRQLGPTRIADFLERYAAAIEADARLLVGIAQRETGLPAEPRLMSVELPRTTNQLRQAARAARAGHWHHATIDAGNNIRSMHAALGAPVLVLGPNNFPFAFNAIAGGDFAAAIAAGNPVIAKAHPAHPGTSARLAAAALASARAAGLPAGAVQMFFDCDPGLGLRLVADPAIGATAFTGSRRAGLALKAAADGAGKPIFLEMSSVNPVFVLAGAQRERGAALAAELHASCALGAGQFCTRPGLVVLERCYQTEGFVDELKRLTRDGAPGVLLTPRSPESLAEVVAQLRGAGAETLAGGEIATDAPGYAFQPTLLRISGRSFLARSAALQHDAFGHVCLLVVAESTQELVAVAAALEGNLTGTICSDTRGGDDACHAELEPVLRARVGRLLNDKMPTGVAVSPAMNHGGPYPATGHPGFTAVGIPASMRRFSALHCYDNVRESRLPAPLRDSNPDAAMWRLIDGAWTTGDVGGAVKRSPDADSSSPAGAGGKR